VVSCPTRRSSRRAPTGARLSARDVRHTLLGRDDIIVHLYELPEFWVMAALIPAAETVVMYALAHARQRPLKVDLVLLFGVQVVAWLVFCLAAEWSAFQGIDEAVGLPVLLVAVVASEVFLLGMASRGPMRFLDRVLVTLAGDVVAGLLAFAVILVVT